MKTTVKLLSHTAYMQETIFSCWHQSRDETSAVLLPEVLAHDRKEDSTLDDEINSLFWKVVDADIPVAENVSFTFALEHVSIALREQLVRHRIGVKVGDRVGMDIVPDLADSTWWAQSMRVLDMGDFASQGAYELPESLGGRTLASRGSDEDAVAAYQAFMATAAELYRRLVAAGVPNEDARNVIPIAVEHRLTWTLNLATLKRLIGKRGCWILQLGLWEPVITGMVEALCNSLSQGFRRLIQPPCIRDDKFDHCHFVLDNEQRCAGKDPLPPCSLFLNQNMPAALAAADRHETPDPLWRFHAPTEGVPGQWSSRDAELSALFRSMQDRYEALWGRSPVSAKRR